MYTYHIFTCIYTYMHIYICIYVYICTHIYIYVSKYVYMCTVYTFRHELHICTHKTISLYYLRSLRVLCTLWCLDSIWQVSLCETLVTICRYYLCVLYTCSHEQYVYISSRTPRVPSVTIYMYYLKYLSLLCTLWCLDSIRRVTQCIFSLRSVGTICAYCMHSVTNSMCVHAGV